MKNKITQQDVAKRVSFENCTSMLIFTASLLLTLTFGTFLILCSLSVCWVLFIIWLHSNRKKWTKNFLWLDDKNTCPKCGKPTNKMDNVKVTGKAKPITLYYCESCKWRSEW